ncbi:MAG: hypothetical protein AAF725_14655 [Acidobacteriota bacterium]
MSTSHKAAPPPPESASGREPAAARLFVGAMLVILLTPPLAQALLDLRLHGRPTVLELLSAMPGHDSLRALESRMDRRSWIGELGRRAWTPRVDRAVERGSSKVVFGQRRWLFYRPALRFVAGRGFADDARRGAEESRADRIGRAIADFSRELGERGTRLLFVPVPTKATVYPERVFKTAPGGGEANDPAVGPLLESLRAAGVEVIDPLPILLEGQAEGAEVFLPADSHWSWAGMHRVARGVASAIAPDEPAREPIFDSRRVRLEADGDLYGLLDSGTDSGGPRSRPPMSLEIWQVVSTREGQKPLQEASKVLVIGDSSTLVFSDPRLGLGRGAGFAERLAYELNQPVDLIASPAAGTRQLQNLLNAQRPRLEAADVVVWVMTQRSFRFAEDDWQAIRLSDLDAAADDDDADQAPISGSLAARVVALSDPPTRDDYADCLMIVRYQTLDDPARRFDVAHVGWRNFAATGAARLEVGDVVDLEVGELPAEQRLDRTCWVDDVGLRGAPLWARSYDVR